MTNQSIGVELDRYAAVNAMFLKMEGSETLDVSYQGYVEFMKDTAWTSPAAEGGECIPLTYFLCSNITCYIFQLASGSTKPVRSLDITRLLIVTINRLETCSHSTFLYNNVRTFLDQNLTSLQLRKALNGQRYTMAGETLVKIRKILYSPMVPLTHGMPSVSYSQ